jgi:hypothetical protein
MSRRARRVLVLAVLAVGGFLLSGFPGSLHGAGIGFVLVLAALDVGLLRASGGLAFARGRSLDERQTKLRDVAYRRGFRLLGLAMVIGLVVVLAGFYLRLWLMIVTQGRLGSLPGQVDGGTDGRLVVAFLELLLMMPTFVIAWMEPAPAGADPSDASPRPARGRRSLSAAVLVLAAITGLWLIWVALAPVQAAGPARGMVVGGGSWPGATCRHFAAGRMIGAVFGATVGTHAEVCWDGRRAFVIGDPKSPPPGPPQMNPVGDPGLTVCGADDMDDFAVVSGVTCSARTDRDGTLHYDLRARVSPLPLSIAAREVRMSLVVTRDGRILEQP